MFLRVPKEVVRPKSKRRAAAPKAPGRHRPTIRLLLVFVAAVILVDALVGDRGLLAMMHARKEYDELAATISRDRAENARLRDEARRLLDDPVAIEEVARRDLGLIRPGEKVFIIKDVGAPARPDAPSLPSPLPAPPLSSAAYPTFFIARDRARAFCELWTAGAASTLL